MGWSDYSSTATTNNNDIKERLKKAAFHFKGPHTRNSFNPKTKKWVKKTSIEEYDFIDLAVLLGLRETCYQQEGDTPLTTKEIIEFVQILNRHYLKQSFIYPKQVEKTLSLEELSIGFSEWNDRLVTGKVSDNEDGSVEAYLNAQTYLGLWRSLTMLHPGSEIDVWNYDDYDDGEVWYRDHNRYLVKYGMAKKIEHTYDEGTTNWEEESEQELPNDKPSVYEEGMKYAYNGDYEKSIEVLSILEGNKNALNNIGVDYERLHNYEKAYEYYLKANTPWSLDNLLGLYNTGKIPMNVEDYKNICEKLIELGDDHGYIYLSKLYYKDHPDVPVNEELALKYAKQGYEAYPNSTFAIFNYAWCLLELGNTEEDKIKSHELFESILVSKQDRDKDIYPIAKYNYAWQCQEGYGCEVDIGKAVYWYIRAFEEGDVNAAWQLARVYKTYEGFINQEAADFWYQQYIEAGGEDDD